jgi:hypothetical protein
MTLGGEAATIVTRPNRTFGTLGAASNGAYLVLVYERVDEANGRVGRVFLDRRVFRSRRHLAN